METPGPKNTLIRIARDASDAIVTQIIDYIYKWKPSYICGVQHDADDEVHRTHIHLAVADIQLKGKRWLDTIRDTLRERFSLKGNSDYAVKQWLKGDEALIYMSKGKYYPFHHYNPRDWETIKVQYVDKKRHKQAQAQVAGAPIPFNEIVVPDSKVNRVTKYELFCEMASDVEIQLRDKQIPMRSYDATKIMVDTCIDVLKQYRQKFPRYVVRDYTDMLRFNETNSRDELYKFCDL